MGKYIFSEHESVFCFKSGGKPSLFKCEREIRFHMKGGNNYYFFGGLCNHLLLAYCCYVTGKKYYNSCDCLQQQHSAEALLNICTLCEKVLLQTNQQTKVDERD